MTKRGKLDHPVSLAVAGAGLIASRRRPWSGAALFAAGLAAAGLVEAVRREGAVPVTYNPVDTPKPLADDIWMVDSGPLHGILPLRMTVIKLPDGGLLLHSPTHLTPSLQAALDPLGPVRALVAPSVAHWMFLPEWQRAYPEAKTWAPAALRVRAQVKKSGVVIDHDLSGTAPMEWGGVLDLLSVPGAIGFVEFAFFHRPSRTLILTDLVQNFEPKRLPVLIRPLARLLGVTAPVGQAPFYLRAVVRGGGWAARHAAGRIVQLRPERVVFAHGRIFDADAADALGRSLSWLLPEGKETI